MIPVTNWLISPPSALQYSDSTLAMTVMQYALFKPLASALRHRREIVLQGMETVLRFTGYLSKKSFYRVPLEIVSHAQSISLSGSPPSNSGSTVLINDIILSLISSLWPVRSAEVGRLIVSGRDTRPGADLRYQRYPNQESPSVVSS
jgi:hypothetical protein